MWGRNPQIELPYYITAFHSAFHSILECVSMFQALSYPFTCHVPALTGCQVWSEHLLALLPIHLLAY